MSADWHFNQLERDGDDALYGTGHRPAHDKRGTGYLAACSCPNPSCDRAVDGWLHRSIEDALHAAHLNLVAAEHGPAAGQEAS